jgi:ABC-2 type transport system permease protein
VKVVTIAYYNLLRMFRERINLFFVFIFPLLIIWIIGTQFGDDSAPEVGISGAGSFAEGVAERLEDTGAADVRWADDRAELEDLVEGGSLLVGVDFPAEFEASLQAADDVEVTVLLGNGEGVPQLEQVVTRAIAAEAVVPSVIGQLSNSAGTDADQVATVVTQTANALPAVEVSRTIAGGGDPDDEPIAMDQIAVGMLLLMTFLNTLTGSAALIQSRKYGVSRRMVGTPTSLRTIVVGEGAGRWTIGIFQALYIMAASALVFGVNWGHLPTAFVIVALFAAVAAGAAMLIGAVMHNDEQAAGITVMAGLALGALGGAMLPLELFGSTLRTIAHATPHAWAIDAFTKMSRHDATVVDVLPELGVLAGMAALLLGLAAWRLRATLTRL